MGTRVILGEQTAEDWQFVDKKIFVDKFENLVMLMMILMIASMKTRCDYLDLHVNTRGV